MTEYIQVSGAVATLILVLWGILKALSRRTKDPMKSERGITDSPTLQATGETCRQLNLEEGCEGFFEDWKVSDLDSYGWIESPDKKYCLFASPCELSDMDEDKPLVKGLSGKERKMLLIEWRKEKLKRITRRGTEASIRLGEVLARRG